MRWRAGVGLIVVGLVGACSRTGGTTTAATVTTTAPVATPALTTSPPATIPTTAPTTIPTTTMPATTMPATTMPATTMPATIPPTTAAGTTTPPPATTAPATVAPANDVVQQIELGRSVEDRPITAVERGTPGGTVVLVIGCIHGDEDAGIGVVDDLMTATLPPGVDLWLVPTMNPDGQADQTRTNAHQVDLNRNFPQNWAPLGQPGDSQYAGTGPASEPETAAVVALVKRIRPALAVWYHQDLNRIDPGTGHSGEVRRRYAELTGLPMAPVTGGTYTGTATQWESALVPKGAAFIVELGPTLDGAGAQTHANAILTLASTG